MSFFTLNYLTSCAFCHLFSHSTIDSHHGRKRYGQAADLERHEAALPQGGRRAVEGVSAQSAASVCNGVLPRISRHCEARGYARPQLHRDDAHLSRRERRGAPAPARPAGPDHIGQNPYSVLPLAAEREENHDEIEKRALETQAKRPTKRKNAHKSIVSKTELFETGFFARENRLLLIFDIFCAIFPIDGNAEYCALLVQTWTEYGFCPCQKAWHETRQIQPAEADKT